jgi:predicted phage terminase large subunit-like protein
MSSGGVRPRGCYEGGAQIINLDDLETILISVDATFRETSDGSFVAIHVWGKNGAYRYLLDAVHRRMDFTDTVKALLGVISRWPEARRKLIEGKANGDAIISTLEKAHGVSGLEAVPASRSKLDRAHAMQPYQSAANVFLPDGVPWLEEYIAEFASFPKGRSDDHVDAQSQALQGLEQARSTMMAWMEAGID